MLWSLSLDEQQHLSCTNQEKDGHCVRPTKVMSGAVSRKEATYEWEICPSFFSLRTVGKKIVSSDRSCKTQYT